MSAICQLDNSATITTMNFLNQKLSSFIFILMTVFILLDILGYFFLRHNLQNLDKQKELVLIYKIQKEMDFLVNKLLFLYEVNKEEMLRKHDEAYQYLKTHSYDSDLEPLRQLLNRDVERSPYNISITNTKYVISNTTSEHDFGFDMSFAKELFKRHQKEKSVGLSIPIFETVSKSFYSFSDQFLPKNEGHRILQVSYNYKAIDVEIKNVHDIMNKYENVQYVRASILSYDGEVSNFIFNVIADSDMIYHNKIKDLETTKLRLKKSQYIVNNLDHKKWKEKCVWIDGTPYKEVFVSQKSPISKDGSLIYSVVFDKKDYQSKLKELNIIIILIGFFGLIAIVVINKLKKKEVLLHDQELFLKHSIHEIRTPLSVISLNNEMRGQQLGYDEFSEQIDSAVKVLDISYNDLSYLITKDNYEYIEERLEVSMIVQERFEYFESIAISQGKRVSYLCDNTCQIVMSKVELIRLIDNNLSNAVKYAYIDSDIKVVFTNNILQIITKSKVIKNKEEVFDAYYREDKIKGGYGLGLSIVQDIAKKYGIKIELESVKEETVFSYKFQCMEDR